MHKVACAFSKDTGELEPLSTTDELKTDNHAGCPLAPLLPHMTKDFDLFFSALVERDILKWEDGHFVFARTSHPCPFTQAQQTEDSHG